MLDAIKAITNVPSSITPPAWLADAAKSPLAAEIVACANGLLHLPSCDLSPATPAFFSLNALDFAFAPEAPVPSEWLRFLNSLWPKDPESISTLQEWFGYCLRPDTRQQKILLIVGPKRSGKGTMGRACSRRFWESPTSVHRRWQALARISACGPNRQAVGDHRRPPRRPGRPAGDCRAAPQHQRRGWHHHRPQVPFTWTGRLTTRFVIMTNELPRIADASGALASRYIVLALRRSFFGHEDHGLTDRLLMELPAILNWAIEGWRRLRERGYFLQPPSSTEEIRQLEDLGSPIGAFLRERCEIGTGLAVGCERLFEQWQNWCMAQGRDHSGTVQTFGRDLRAAVPSLGTERPRLEDGSRERRYLGVALKGELQ